MKKAVFVVVLLMLTKLTEAGDRRSVVSIQATIRTTVVRVSSNRSKLFHQEYSEGTGFAVLDGHHVLTCLHVVDKSKGRGVFDQSNKAQAARIVKIDKKNDLALLWIKKALPPVKLARKDVRSSEPVHQISHPEQSEWAETAGKLKWQFSNRNAFKIKSEEGYSGSPIFNVNGEVVSITQFVIPGLTCGADLKTIKEFLASVSR